MAPAPDSDQPILMCPGQKAQYVCNAGGIDIRQDNHDLSTFETSCQPDLTYAESSINWPQCIDRLDCPIPKYDDFVLQSSWQSGDSLTPPFSIDFECIRPNKKILTYEDRENFVNDNMVDILTINCFLNGTYDWNPEDFTCTNPCQPPKFPEDWYQEIMEHDWDSDLNLEIEQEVNFKCKNGRKMVKKRDFLNGNGEAAFLDQLMSSCQVDGALNQTIGNYMCTKACQNPTNYSQVFTWDWDESAGNFVCILHVFL